MYEPQVDRAFDSELPVERLMVESLAQALVAVLACGYWAQLTDC